MSLDMIGERILILLVILKGYYYDFVLRNDAEILCRVYTTAQKKRVNICCGWYPMAHVIRGSLDRTEDFS